MRGLGIMSSFTVAFDATHANIGSLPKGELAAGYDTGSPEIQWTAADWAAHPHAIHICQDAGATDVSSDVLDVEAGAATDAEVASWAKAAEHDFITDARPGQRAPAIYASADRIAGIAAALEAGGVHFTSFWVANWNLNEAQAIADLLKLMDSYPVIGVQFRNAGNFDCDVFSTEWLNNVSHPKPPPPVHVVLTADGHRSLHQYASDLHTTVAALGLVSATYLTDKELGPLVRYLSGGNWNVFGRSGANRVMPKGTKFATMREVKHG